MLLCCDIGNSNIVLGLYHGDTLAASWRLTSRLNATEDEYSALIGTLLTNCLGAAPAQPEGRAIVTPAAISAAVISSVVPPLTGKLSRVLARIAGADPLLVAPGVRTGLDIQYEDPREVGADRIVNTVGALTRYTPPVIIVDSGTATTFDVVLPPNIYLGGVILPGLYISLDALVSRTAKLPKVELRPISRVVGRNTADSIRSGLFHGGGAAVDGMVERICAEQALTPKVIATGGFAELLAQASRRIEAVEPDLTLIGLHEIWRMNAS